MRTNAEHQTQVARRGGVLWALREWLCGRAWRGRGDVRGRDKDVARASYKSLMRIGGQPIPLNIRVNPRARRIIVKVHPSTGEVAVVAPSARAVNPAIDFARAERDWIAERLAKIRPAVPFAAGSVLPYRGVDHVIRWTGDTRGVVKLDIEALRPTIRVSGGLEFVGRRLEDWFKRQARAHLTRKVEAYAEELGVRVKRVSIRDGASRWGSCSSTGALSFSWRLIMAPPFVLDYVAAHEVAHLREMNHGPRFWRLVDRLVDDAAEAQEWLRENGSHLHRYGVLNQATAVEVLL